MARGRAVEAVDQFWSRKEASAGCPRVASQTIPSSEAAASSASRASGDSTAAHWPRRGRACRDRARARTRQVLGAQAGPARNWAASCRITYASVALLRATPSQLKRHGVASGSRHAAGARDCERRRDGAARPPLRRRGRARSRGFSRRRGVPPNCGARPRSGQVHSQADVEVLASGSSRALRL